MVLASRFKVFCQDAGLKPEAVGKLLHVTPRTVRYWLSGKTAIPYAAYRLLRILRLWELPPPFEGWRIHSGRLWTPEGRGIEPCDGSWWSLLVAQAQSFRTLYEREAAMRVALAARTPGCAPRSGGRRAAQPPGLVIVSTTGTAGVEGLTNQGLTTPTADHRAAQSDITLITEGDHHELSATSAR